MADWYLSVGGGQSGPFSTDQLRGMRTSGAIPPGAFLWRDGMPEWRPEAEIDLGPLQPPPQQQPHFVSPPGPAPHAAPGPAPMEPPPFGRSQSFTAPPGPGPGSPFGSPPPQQPPQGQMLFPCVGCGRPIHVMAPVCPNCGAPNVRNPNFSPTDKRILIAFVLCFFLGGLGLHRFYVGKWGTGILMIVTLAGLGIWWLVDMIIIATGNFTDSNGNKITIWM